MSPNTQINPLYTLLVSFKTVYATWGSQTMVDKNRGFIWEKQEPLFDFVWYIKATIKPKVDKRTASYMCWV